MRGSTRRTRKNYFYWILVVGLRIHLYKAAKDVACDFVLARSGKNCVALLSYDDVHQESSMRLINNMRQLLHSNVSEKWEL